MTLKAIATMTVLKRQGVHNALREPVHGLSTSDPRTIFKGEYAITMVRSDSHAEAQ